MLQELSWASTIIIQIINLITNKFNKSRTLQTNGHFITTVKPMKLDLYEVFAS